MFEFNDIRNSILVIDNKGSSAVELKNILSSSCVTGNALDCFLWTVRSQLFWDGNKRTATLAANKILIPNGKGVFSVEEKDHEQFNELLTYFYNSGNTDKIKDFLYSKCIHGIEY